MILSLVSYSQIWITLQTQNHWITFFKSLRQPQETPYHGIPLTTLSKVVDQNNISNMLDFQSSLQSGAQDSELWNQGWAIGGKWISLRRKTTSYVSNWPLEYENLYSMMTCQCLNLRSGFFNGNISFLVLMCLNFVIFVSNRSMTNVDIHTFFKGLGPKPPKSRVGIQDLN